MAHGRDDDLIFGIHSVLEKLTASPGDVREIRIATTMRPRTLEKIREAARRGGCPVERMDTAALDAMTGHARHQGVIARIAPYGYESFPELLARLEDSGTLCVVLLDGITDPRNFGSILRTSEAMGITDIVIPRDRAVGVTATAIKASAGAAHHLRIYRVSNLSRSLTSLRQRGVWTIGLDPRGETSLHEMRLPDKVGVVLGAEGAGMRSLVRSKCDYLVSLPMRGKVESMNVSVAWGMFAYELMRQRAKNRGAC